MPGSIDPSVLMTNAAWALVVAYALSISYELWRATVRSGRSRHDSLPAFVRQNVPLYVVAAVVITLLFLGGSASAWIGLIFALIAIFASIFYYNPKILLERQPGPVDWFEDLAFTGLHFVTAALLLYEVGGRALTG